MTTPKPTDDSPATKASGADTRVDSVDRRRFLGKAAAGAAAGALVTACGASEGSADAPAVQTQRQVRWRLASSFPRALDSIFGGAERLAEELEALTGGRFTMRTYPAGELVPGLEVMDAVQQGTVQVGHSPSYYYTGKSQLLAFDTCVPFGLTARQQSAWLHQGGGLELMRGVFSDFGIINFPGGNTGAQMGGWFRREIAGADDLRGLKMRIPGLGGEVMDRLGATVQVLAAGDIFPALERGTIDATEWVGPYDDEKLGLHKAAPYYYYPGWWEPGPSMSFQVNRAAWDQLSVDDQAVFRVAAYRAETSMLTAYDARNPAALRRLVEGGTQLRRFSDEIMQVSLAASTEMLEERAAADASYRAVYEPWKAFRDESFRWFSTNEQAYASFAFTAG